VAYTWNVVDAVVAALRDKQVKTTGDRERFVETYAAWKHRLIPVVRKRAFNRINLALALYHVAYQDTFDDRLDITALVDEASGLDFDALVGPGKTIDLYPSTVRQVIVELKRQTCTHGNRATRTRVAITNDAALSNAEFLASQQGGRVEWYCVDCGTIFSVKKLAFTPASVLKAIRSLSRSGQDGVLLKDVIQRLKQEYIVCPRQNADARKQQATEYMAVKALLQPFIERGLVAVDDVVRNKRVHVSATPRTTR